MENTPILYLSAVFEYLPLFSFPNKCTTILIVVNVYSYKVSYDILRNVVSNLSCVPLRIFSNMSDQCRTCLGNKTTLLGLGKYHCLD